MTAMLKIILTLAFGAIMFHFGIKIGRFIEKMKSNIVFKKFCDVLLRGMIEEFSKNDVKRFSKLVTRATLRIKKEKNDKIKNIKRIS